MAKEISTKPYLIRALHEWCADCGYTPYISVRPDERTRVPQEFVKGGEIVLNLSTGATRNLTIGNDLIQFSARFHGVSRECSVPVSAVAAIFARENGQGMLFPVEPVAALGEGQEAPERGPGGESPAPGGRPKLQVIK
ncbi:MAG TPA: ClpXP protease specificity-enhancing factor [Burkholderiales bacterium]